METKALRLFMVLAEELHFSRAARRAGVTQSALSGQIKRLEDRVGGALFQRTTRDVRLTETGAELRRQAEGALRRMDDALAATRAKASGEGRFIRVGLTSAILVSDVMRRIANSRRANPAARLIIREMGTVDQEAALANGDLDIGVLHPPLTHRDLTATKIRSERFVCAFNPDFFTPPPEPSWGDIFQFPLVFYQRRRAPRLYAELLRCADEGGDSALIVAEAESFFAAAAMAQAGLGVAFLPRDVARMTNMPLPTVDLPEGGALTLDAAVVTHPNAANDPAIGGVVASLKITP
ncbi:MAG: LysR family transcriptional regulator [Pseudomonadota bacterium]